MPRLLPVLFAALPLGSYGQTFAIRNNLLYDAATTPNLSAEVRLAPRWSAGATVGFNPFSFGMDSNDDYHRMRHLLIMPQVRYWFCDVFSGHFLSANVAWVHYNISDIDFPLGLFPATKGSRRQGDAAAIGASWGYHHILSPHWSLEAEAGADIGYAWSKVYKCRHCGRYLGDDNKWVFMPKVALNVVFLL